MIWNEAQNFMIWSEAVFIFFVPMINLIFILQITIEKFIAISIFSILHETISIRSIMVLLIYKRNFQGI